MKGLFCAEDQRRAGTKLGTTIVLTTRDGLVDTSTHDVDCRNHTHTFTIQTQVSRNLICLRRGSTLLATKREEQLAQKREDTASAKM